MKFFLCCPHCGSLDWDPVPDKVDGSFRCSKCGELSFTEEMVAVSDEADEN